MKQNVTGIKSWAEEDRPREKMLQKGAEALSNSELIAIFLGSGNKNETAVDLARRILKDADDNLNTLSRHTIKTLSQYKGVGEAKAITVMAALEFGKRIMIADVAKKPALRSSKDCYEYMFPYLHQQPYEQFWTVFLDRSNKVLRKELIGIGGITSTSVDPKKIIKIALEEYASSMILCHNHPSGNPTPSNQDKYITTKIKTAAGFFEINIIDHIIIGAQEYFSFADEGIL